jgi:23S rRNA (guanosine2251-2'-O)-methyltransferase
LLFGVGLAIIPTRRSASVGETVSRASAGASHLVPITYVANLRSALERCREAGWWLFAAESSGTPIDEVTLHPRSVFVLGAEGKGVSPNITKIADELVAVPTVQDAGGSVDSLNVSVAAGILLYEYRRRRP